MRILRYLAIAFVLCVCASAQTVTITLQVTDAGGQSWNNGTWSAQLTGCPTTCNILGTSTPVPNQQQSGSLSGSGGASVVVTSVSSIAPSGTQWTFSVCPNASSPCFQSAIAPVSNVTFNDTPPVIAINMSSPPPLVRAYVDSELFGQVAGSEYFNVTTGFQKYWNGSSWVTLNAGVLGLADPGSNGIVKRTALNITAVAASADLIALWTGTCNATTFLRGDGSCQAVSGGTGNVTTTPGVGVNQFIIQQPGTSFGANVFEKISYVDSSFNWSFAPGGSYTGGVGATLTFNGSAPNNQCPIGVYGVDVGPPPTNSLYVYISGGTGAAEAVLITGGTCTPGLGSGTLTFTPVNSHSGAFTVGSSSTGWYEAYRNAAATNNNNLHLICQPTNPPASSYYSFFAPVILLGGTIDIDGAGCTADVENTRAAFVMPTQNVGPVQVHGFRVSTRSTTLNATNASASITNTVCAANVCTITSTLNPPVGSYVVIQQTFNTAYWGPHLVATTSASNWTYACTGCVISSQATAGGNAYEFAFVETNGEGTQVHHLAIDSPGGFNANTVNNLVVVLNDQNFHIHDIQENSQLGGCNANFCSNLILAPGPFSPNAAVVYVDHIGGSISCSGNGITAYNGNTIHVSDAVLQGFSEWSVETGGLRGGFGTTPSQFDNIYNEVGACSNPLYPGGGLAARAEAGVITWGGSVAVHGGEFPIGNMPQFAATGNQGTQYNYFLVIHDSLLGVSVPMQCGYALVDSVTPTGSITVACPRVQGTNTITYDILRTAGTNIQPFNGGCGGGSTTACGSVLTAQAQCSTTICSFTDTASASTTAYTVNDATYFPIIPFWPGGPVLLSATETQNPNNAVVRFESDENSFITNISPFVSEVLNVPQVYLHVCNASTVGVWAVCASGNSFGNNAPSNASLLLQNGAYSGGFSTSNIKGRLNFLTTGGITQEHVITIVDSNPHKTIAGGIGRPSNDVNDTFIGLDQAGGGFASAQLTLGAPVAISRYIANIGDNTSWLERLTSSLESFKVPVSTTSTITASGLGTFNGVTSSGGAISSPTGPVSGNWNCVSVAPVTVSTSTTNDQNLMACTVPAGTLNSVGKTLRIHTKSLYSTPAASTATLTFKAKLCSVSGCGSGNVATLVSIASSANAGSITNNTAILDVETTTQTAGAASRSEASGDLIIDLGAAATSADTVFGDTNATVIAGSPSDIDFTAQNFLQITVAFSVASGSNTVTERQLVVDSVN